jgi:peptidoglycan/xylan/chitin deacetylase (PgdA/CDA1 family)
VAAPVPVSGTHSQPSMSWPRERAVSEAIRHRASISGSPIPAIGGEGYPSPGDIDWPAVPLVPILLYHSVSSAPPPVIRPFAVDERTFGDHLDLVAERGLASLTVTEYVDAIERGDGRLLERAVVITFDDGFADFETALAALAGRGLAATLFVATGLLRGAPRPVNAPDITPHMLHWDRLRELSAAGVEIGAHSHSHPQLDSLSERRAREEIELSRRLVQEAIGADVETFAYPNGYSSARVRRLVRAEGVRAACAVKNTFSSERDDRFALARLMIRSSTGTEEVARWLDRSAAPPPRSRERARTKAWRAYRRGRAIVTRRAGATPGWPVTRV